MKTLTQEQIRVLQTVVVHDVTLRLDQSLDFISLDIELSSSDDHQGESE